MFHFYTPYDTNVIRYNFWFLRFLGVEKRNMGVKWVNDFNPLTTNVPHRIKTSQLICNVSQLTGFYMMGDIGY